MKTFIVTFEHEVEVEAKDIREALQRIYELYKTMPISAIEKDNHGAEPEYPIGACEACEACEKIILAGDECVASGEDGILCAKCAREMKE